MDGWPDGRMNVIVGGWGRKMDGRMNGLMYGWMGGWIDGWMDGRTKEWLD